MTTENTDLTQSLAINDDGEIGDLAQSIIINDDEDFADEDFATQFANLKDQAHPEEAKSTDDDTEDEDGFDIGALAVTAAVQENSRPTLNNFDDGSMKFMSMPREGAFNDQFQMPGPLSSSSRRQPKRLSFVNQLQNLNEDTSDTESLGHSMTSSNASELIDHRLRRSSLGTSLAGLFGLENLESLIDDDKAQAEEEKTAIVYDDHVTDPLFESRFTPDDMRCLALVAHNHMKPAMKTFVQANKNVLCKFKLTGTNTTMTMLREVFGDDDSVKFGPTCTSGPLGGDAELVAIMCTENLGGLVFFADPMSSHPHAADIECLSRQANVHNVLMMPNPATAYACMESMRVALREGRAEMIPSFFKTLQSPSVAEYKIRQARVVKKNSSKK